MNQVHPATIKDIPQLCELLSILFTLETDFHPDKAKQSDALREIIENPNLGRILVLREGETIVGMVNLLFTISTACGGKVAILEDMIIHPLRQGDGLGSKLLSSALDFAMNQGCHRITLLTDRANVSAIRFYERHGFGISGMIPLRFP